MEGWEMQKNREERYCHSIKKKEYLIILVRYQIRSLRRVEQDFNISLRSIQDILQNRLHIFPYKLRVVQKIEDRDYIARIKIAQWCL